MDEANIHRFAREIKDVSDKIELLGDNRMRHHIDSKIFSDVFSEGIKDIISFLKNEYYFSQAMKSPYYLVDGLTGYLRKNNPNREQLLLIWTIPGLPSKYAAHCYERNSRLLLQSRPDFSEQEHYNITLHHNGIESFQGSNIMCGFSKISLDEFHWHINITVNGMRLFNEGGQEIGRFEYYYGQRGNMGNRYISNQPLLQRWVVSKDAISKARCIVGCPNNIKINHAFDSVIRKYED